MRYLLFLPGEIRSEQPLRDAVRPDDRLIGVDGGTDVLVKLGLHPSIIIGDLDSISAGVLEEAKAKGALIEQHPRDKDQTDLELSLTYAVTHGALEIVFIGALGGRIDHTLGNLFLLTKPELRGIAVSLFDGETRATLVEPHRPITLRGAPGDTLSLLPLTPRVQGANLGGVNWPLVKEELAQNSSRTLSNRFIAATADISISAGLLLAIQVPRQT